MKRDTLKEKLAMIEDEQVKKEIIDFIMSEHGKDIEQYKQQVNELTETVGSYENNLADLNARIGEVDTLTEDKTKLSEELRAWQGKYNELINRNKVEAEDRAIVEALKKADCIDTDFAIYKIGRDNFHFNEGKLIGFDDTISDFKSEHPTFFNTVKKAPTQGDPSKDGVAGRDDEFAKFEQRCSELGW